MLRELAAVPRQDRERAVDDRMRKFTNLEAASARIAELKSQSLSLRKTATLLFVYTFGFGPLLYYGLPVPAWSTVCFYLLGFLGCWAFTVLDYSSLRRWLYKEPFWKRFRHVAMLLISPASAMRSAEILLRTSLADYHPLAVALVVCPRSRCETIAKRVLLDLRYPMPDQVPGEPSARLVYDWFHARLGECLEEMLRHAGIDPAALLQPPAALADARSYCPRCHNQYVIAEGSCADCGGVSLAPFAAAAG